jgi:membrane protein
MRIGDIWHLVKTAAKDWVEDEAPQLSAAIAYYTIFSIAPLLLIAIMLGGVFLGERAAQGQIVEQVSHYVGKSGATAIESMIAGARRSGGGVFATIASIAVLLFGASGVFGQLRTSLNKIWEVPPRKEGGFLNLLKSRGLAFLMVLGIGALLLASLAVSAVLTSLTSFAANVVPGKSVLLHLADFAGTVLITTLLFALIYKYLPDVEIAWRDVWVGAVITAVLFAIGKIGIGFYLGHSTVASSYGLAGSVIVVLLWTYYSAMILLFGAELTQAYSCRFGSRMGASGPVKGEKFRKRPATAAALARLPSGGKPRENKEHSMPAIRSETQYLEEEAALARSAIDETVKQLRQFAGDAVNPVVWTRQYPWAAVGIAAAAGLLAGNVLRVPDKRTRRKIKRAWKQRRQEADQHQRARQALLAELAAARDGERSTLARVVGPFGRAAIRMLKATLKSGVLAALSAGTATAAARSTAEDVAAEQTV